MVATATTKEGLGRRHRHFNGSCLEVQAVTVWVRAEDVLAELVM